MALVALGGRVHNFETREVVLTSTPSLCIDEVADFKRNPNLKVGLQRTLLSRSSEAGMGLKCRLCPITLYRRRGGEFLRAAAGGAAATAVLVPSQSL